MERTALSHPAAVSSLSELTLRQPRCLVYSPVRSGLMTRDDFGGWMTSRTLLCQPARQIPPPYSSKKASSISPAGPKGREHPIQPIRGEKHAGSDLKSRAILRSAGLIGRPGARGSLAASGTTWSMVPGRTAVFTIWTCIYLYCTLRFVVYAPINVIDPVQSVYRIAARDGYGREPAITLLFAKPRHRHSSLPDN